MAADHSKVTTQRRDSVGFPKPGGLSPFVQPFLFFEDWQSAIEGGEDQEDSGDEGGRGDGV